MITIAATGLNCGNIKKSSLPATAAAESTASTAISFADGFFFSKLIKKAARHSTSTARIISRCFLVPLGIKSVPSITVKGIRTAVITPATISDGVTFFAVTGGFAIEFFGATPIISIIIGTHSNAYCSQNGSDGISKGNMPVPAKSIKINPTLPSESITFRKTESLLRFLRCGTAVSGLSPFIS